MKYLRGYRGFLVITLLIALIGGAFLYLGNGNGEVTYESVTVRRGDLTHEVSVTGRVEPTKRVELAFEVGGRVKTINLREGDTVEQGDVIAVLDGAVLEARLAEARADVTRERASLQEILAGTRDEEVAVVESSVEKSEIEVMRASKELNGLIERTYVLASDEIREQVDQLFDEPTSSGPKFEVTISQGTTKYIIRAPREKSIQLTEGRVDVTNQFIDWKTMIETQKPEDVSVRAMAAEEHLESIQEFLELLSDVVNNLTPDNTTQQAVYDNFKADVSGARSTISSLLLELRAQHEQYDITVASSEVTERELIKTDAPARGESIAVQEAQISRAQSSVASINAELDQLYLRAPISGVVTNIDMEVGEVLTGGAKVVELITQETFELSAFIPEADIAEVTLGNEARVTLDAFDRSRIFEAEVVEIAVGETIRDGVPTYETTLLFTGDTSDVKSGMTAEIDILTSHIEDVILIPQRSIVRDGAREFVRVVEGEGELEERDVITGLKSSSGMIEIKEGLRETEEIVLFLDE